MTGSVAPYLALITSEHAGAPKFSAMVAATLQPCADVVALLGTIPALFDVDSAVGVQLDVIGQWVGRSRFLATPITGVYFSLGDAAVGLGKGVWKGPFDPLLGLVSLPDDIYRTLLRAVIAANSWDGSIPAAYAIWDTVFNGAQTILIQDNGDMTMLFALLGAVPDAVTLALLTGGYIALKPEGVRIAGYVVPSVPAVPFFGLGVENASISGLGVGAWGTFLPPT